MLRSGAHGAGGPRRPVADRHARRGRRRRQLRDPALVPLAERKGYPHTPRAGEPLLSHRRLRAARRPARRPLEVRRISTYWSESISANTRASIARLLPKTSAAVRISAIDAFGCFDMYTSARVDDGRNSVGVGSAAAIARPVAVSRMTAYPSLSRSATTRCWRGNLGKSSISSLVIRQKSSIDASGRSNRNASELAIRGEGAVTWHLLTTRWQAVGEIRGVAPCAR